jgi:hypothetical protein
MDSSFETISAEEIASVLGQDISVDTARYISSLDLTYTTLSHRETTETIRRLLQVLVSSELAVAGPHRRNDWEEGWSENLASFESEPIQDNLIPKYFGKGREARWRQKLIRPTSRKFEASMLSIIVRIFAEKYLKNSTHIAEFGCGTGVNLLDVRAVNASARICGLDWASSSQRLVKRLADQRNDERLEGRLFDFFSPDYAFELGTESAAITVAALEQVGEAFDQFLSFLLKKRPSVCIHIEPVAELLDPYETLDLISLEYFRKRGYLSGFLPELQRRAELGQLVIHEVRRTFSGSLFIEGHSIIVWSPKP